MFREIVPQEEIIGLFDLYPADPDRKAWESIPKNYRNRLEEEGEKRLDYEFTPIYAKDFMEFCRTGNRSHYEEKLFLRRTALNVLVLAECVRYRWKFHGHHCEPHIFNL